MNQTKTSTYCTKCTQIMVNCTIFHNNMPQKLNNYHLAYNNNRNNNYNCKVNNVHFSK